MLQPIPSAPFPAWDPCPEETMDSNKQEAKLDRLVAALDKEADLPTPARPTHKDADPPGLDVRVAADLGDETDEEDGVDPEPGAVSGDEPDGDDEPGNGAPGGRDTVDARRKLLDEDPDEALMQAFGASPDELGVDKAEWVQVRRAKKRVRDREAKVFGAATRIQEEYGPMVKAREAFKAGNYPAFAELIEGITGETYETANVRVMRALPNPGDAKKDKVIADLQSKLAPKVVAVPDGPDPALVEAVSRELRKNHPARRLPDWDKEVANLLTETADADGDPTMTVAEVADALYETYEKEVAERAAKLQPKVRGTRPRAQASSGAKKRKMTLDDLMADLNKENE